MSNVFGNRQYFIFKPINQSPDGFGHNSGLSQIKFSLSNQNKIIEEVRLVGNFYSYNSDGSVHDEADATEYNTPIKAGLNGVFKTMTVASKTQGRVIERVNNIHRLSASVNTMLNDDNDMNTDLMGWAFNDADVTNRNGFEGQAFSLQLPLGLFNSGNDVIDLSDGGFAGLNLTLNMNTDATIYSGTNAVAQSPYAVIREVALVGSWRSVEPTAKGRVIPFKTYSSYFNVLNSSNENTSTTLGLSNVTGFFANFLATSSASSYANACDDLTQLDNLNRVSFAKGGKLRPNSYRVRPVPLPDSEGSSNQILRQYNSAVMPFNDIKHSNINLQQRSNGAGQNQGVGCRFTTTGGQGESFQNSVFQVNLESDLGTTAEVPTGMYSFFINQNVLGVRGGQVVVSS
tara:strand:- start:8571 stop:9773 length:1203 start_codon:yes stop_codon:yes gene_type:complete